MIRYFCDVCGKEICGEWITRFTVSADIISQYRGGGSKSTELHFHERCMSKMFESLKKEVEEDGT